MIKCFYLTEKFEIRIGYISEMTKNNRTNPNYLKTVKVIHPFKKTVSVNSHLFLAEEEVIQFLKDKLFEIFLNLG